jgi:hypothetical protein
MGNTILGANTLSSGFEVANSCMFNDDDSAYMHITRGSAGNQRTFTISMWIKRSLLGGTVYFFASGPDNNNSFSMHFNSDQLEIWEYKSSAYQFRLKPKFRFRDVTAWYHVVVAVDTTQGTDTNRVKFYINGTQYTEFDTTNWPSQNYDTYVNDDAKHWLGKYTDQSAYYDGYLAEVVVLDGTAANATSFGEFDSDSPNVWKPIDVSGLTFGTNGFYLDFEDSSNLGNDANGGTDWTEVNLAATDQSTDTCTNNFATLNPLVKGNTAFTFLQGNIQVDSGNNWGHGVGTIGLASGKWYWEVDNITASSNVFFGICNEFNLSHLTNDSTPYSEAGLMLYFQDGRRTIDGTSSEGEYNAYGTTHGFALDLDSGTRTIKFYRDNSLEGTENLTANFPAGEFVFPILMMSASSNACGVDFNFGGTIASALASAESDENGYGSFEFAPPSGYYAICTKNIAEYG